jgi:hypothetical protein
VADFEIFKLVKTYPQSAGFEPARGDPIAFRVQRLNHSATTARCTKENLYYLSFSPQMRLNFVQITFFFA